VFSWVSFFKTALAVSATLTLTAGILGGFFVWRGIRVFCWTCASKVMLALAMGVLGWLIITPWIGVIVFVIGFGGLAFDKCDPDAKINHLNPFNYLPCAHCKGECGRIVHPLINKLASKGDVQSDH